MSQYSKILVKMKFGSHLYGTNTPKSDLDIKGVFLPCKEDLLLQRASKNIVSNTKKEGQQKNTSEDVDVQLISLQEFFKLLMDGQTMALDMLFAPESVWTEHSPEWLEIRQFCMQNLLCSKTASFVGYCQQQAAKYGIKGSRVATVRSIVDLLESLPLRDKLADHWDKIVAWVATANPKTHQKGETDIAQIVDLLAADKVTVIPHLDVCNRKVSKTAGVKYAVDIYRKVFEAYGQRALAAETNLGVDFKALSHAVRVCSEAIELLSTGKITFPRPDADVLLKIKTEQMPYKEVAEIIEKGLIDVQQARETTVLPYEPNRDAADKVILSYHFDIIVK